MRNHTQVFPETRKEKNCALKSLQSEETQKVRDKTRRKHDLCEESKERQRPHSSGRKSRKFHKGVGKRGQVGGRRKHSRNGAGPMPKDKTVRTGPGLGMG